MGVVIKFHTNYIVINYDINRPITNCDPQYMTSEIIMHSFFVTSANIAMIYR